MGRVTHLVFGRRRLFGVLAIAALAVLAIALSTRGSAHAASSAPTAAQGQALASLPGVSPVMTCDAVSALDVSKAVGAATGITSATVATAPQGWQYCDVKGVVAPQIQFELQLPLTTYQQRYLQDGCGGLCGTLNIRTQAAAGCVPVNDGAFAVASDNQGHVAAGNADGSFGIDPQLRVDFAYRADHVVALASKALIAAFYGQAPRYSYWDGCSQGGHEGLTEAQRYPHDFDGILAGAPASITQELNTFVQPWLSTINTDAQGNVILPAAKIGVLHAAVLNACDAIDGLKDGQIDDPRVCTFDPASLQCPGADAPDCLTPAQVAVVRKAYSGPVDPKGRHLYPGGEPLGSELAWIPWFVPAPSAPQTQKSTISYGIGSGWLRFLAFPQTSLTYDVPPSHFTLGTFKRASRWDGFYNATDPDLSAFKRAGGKLILWHGWADQAIPPTGTIAYYTAVQKAMGGASETTDFARLFMLPGVNHCGGGEGPDTIDLLTPLLAWVESGKAPAQVTASKLDATGKVVRTRPVYPYPQVARYKGTGSTDDAASFQPTAPPKRFDDAFDWVGSFKTHPKRR